MGISLTGFCAHIEDRKSSRKDKN